MSVINENITALMAENGRMKELLAEMLPDMESRVQGLTESWPDHEVLTALHRNESFIRRIKQFLEDWSH